METQEYYRIVALDIMKREAQHQLDKLIKFSATNFVGTTNKNENYNINEKAYNKWKKIIDSLENELSKIIEKNYDKEN